MPIYAFICESCGHQFDRLQKLSDADPTQCPECGQESVHRQLTAPQFRLSGGGWYETDFKTDKDKKRNLAGDASAAPVPASAAASTDKKSDSTPSTSATTGTSNTKPSA